MSKNDKFIWLYLISLIIEEYNLNTLKYYHESGWHRPCWQV